jgi:hypothetical protein
MATYQRHRTGLLPSSGDRSPSGRRRRRLPVSVLVGAAVTVALVALVGVQTQALQLSASESGGNTPTIWSIEETPNPSSSQNQFLGLSCSAPTSCMAVGSGQNGSSLVASAAIWDGSTWTATSDPDPGAFAAELDSVWCADADACIAVGQDPDAPFYALTEFWDGSTWSAMAGGNNEGAVLNSVSCTSISNCVAVGWNGDPFAETWNGSSWAVTANPDPGAPENLGLASVSCVVADMCLAVGDGSSEIPASMSTEWNGEAWTVEPEFTYDNEAVPFSSVSCTSPTFCLAVGTVPRGTAPAVWDGSTWTGTTAVTVNGDLGTALNSVSCSDSTDCVAVGQIYKKFDTPWAETWDGSTWTQRRTPSTGRQDLFSAVSCPAAGSCFAAGQYWQGMKGRKDRTLIESGVAPVPATITKVKPLSGHVGSRVTIKGSGLAGAMAVTFNGTAAVIGTDSETRLVTKVPAGATTGYIEVTTDGTTSSPEPFTVEPGP